jgi:hypothetical protein
VGRWVYSIWNKEELPDKWKESIIVLIYNKGNETGCSSYFGISLLITSEYYPMFFSEG